MAAGSAFGGFTTNFATSLAVTLAFPLPSSGASLLFLGVFSVGLDFDWWPEWLAQHMREMGADGFAFAVRVTCEVDGVGGLSCFAKLVDYFYLAGNHLVGGLEDIFGQ